MNRQTGDTAFIDAAVENRAPKTYQWLAEPVTVSVPRSIVLQADPADAITFYSKEWDWKILLPIASSLHVGDLVSLGSSPLFLDMMTAMSASHLSRNSPQRRLLIAPTVHAHNFQPNTAHESVSQEFYGSVMKKMARWSERDFGTNPILGLAILTLFCLIESSMGSFRSFGLHYEGATKLIENFATAALNQECQARALLEPLVEASMQMWWRRVYFSTPSFHRNRPSVTLGPEIERLNLRQGRRATILMIMCESHRINNAAIIAHWDHYYVNAHHSSASSKRDSSREYMMGFSSKMKTEEQKLDYWAQAHPFSGGVEDTDDDTPPPKVRPLRMQSHTDAMDFAYYIASRVLQSAGPLDSLHLDNVKDIRSSYIDVESWIHLLLRIVAGLDWKDCVRYNTYTIGITGILLACLLRSHDPRIGQWCQQWLQGCLDGSSFEEGSFPAFQTLNIMKLVNNERNQGRDVIGLYQTVEDGGGSGKLGSYQSQALSSVLLYGRCRLTGQLYSYCISV